MSPSVTITVLLLVGLFVVSPSHAQTCAPVQECGDVDDSGGVVTTDALFVLRKAVGQNPNLVCECGGGGTCESELEDCQDDLEVCESQPNCGNGSLEGDEVCDVGTLNGLDCTSFGNEGGTLRCTTGCEFDTSGCYEKRFDDSGPTIIDNETGLEWEKKISDNGVGNLTEPHDADNVYTWAQFLSVPNGSVFMDFLVRLNTPTGAGANSHLGPTATGCYANHCDWRLPTVEEVATILKGDNPDCPAPCLYPEFDPPLEGRYWTLSTATSDTNNAWTVDVAIGAFATRVKTQQHFARAVRGGH
jgi:hypothetical protein